MPTFSSGQEAPYEFGIMRTGGALRLREKAPRKPPWSPLLVKVRLVCVGKLANPNLKALSEDYRKRLERMCDLEIVEVKDAADKDGLSRLAREAERIRAAAEPFSECALWDEAGDPIGSLEFSQLLGKMENRSARRFTMIIGSSHGVAEDLKAEIPRKLQLSRFTFTHEWARVLALEQLYRARCIQKNLPYHH